MRRRDAVIKNRDKLIEIIMRMSPENMRRTLQDFAVENYLAGYEESKEEFNKEKQAYWIGEKAHPICSKCNCNVIEEHISYDGYAEVHKPMRFCPNCGCRMIEQQENEE